MGLDLSCLGFHQVFADGQPKLASADGPAAGFIDSEKTVEQMRQHVFIHPRSVIAETEHQNVNAQPGFSKLKRQAPEHDG